MQTTIPTYAPPLPLKVGERVTVTQISRTDIRSSRATITAVDDSTRHPGRQSVTYVPDSTWLGLWGTAHFPPVGQYGTHISR